MREVGSPADQLRRQKAELVQSLASGPLQVADQLARRLRPAASPYAYDRVRAVLCERLNRPPVIREFWRDEETGACGARIEFGRFSHPNRMPLRRLFDAPPHRRPDPYACERYERQWSARANRPTLLRRPFPVANVHADYYAMRRADGYGARRQGLADGLERLVETDGSPFLDGAGISLLSDAVAYCEGHAIAALCLFLYDLGCAS